MIESTDIKRLDADTDGLTTYEYIANHIGDMTDEDLDFLIGNIARVDLTGQVLISAAR